MWNFFGICLFIEGRMPWFLLVSNLRITVVLVKELELGVGRCWASISAQVCQPVLLSVQFFLVFRQRSQIAQYRCVFIYLFYQKVICSGLKQRLGWGFKKQKARGPFRWWLFKVVGKLSPYVVR